VFILKIVSIESKLLSSSGIKLIIYKVSELSNNFINAMPMNVI